MKISFPDRSTGAGEARFQKGLMLGGAAVALAVAAWVPFMPAYLGVAALAGAVAFGLQWFEWCVLSRQASLLANFGLCLAIAAHLVCQKELLPATFQGSAELGLTLQFFMVFVFSHGALHALFPSVLELRPMPVKGKRI